MVLVTQIFLWKELLLLLKEHFLQMILWILLKIEEQQQLLLPILPNDAAIDGKLTFNNAPLVNYISKINDVLNENAEDLDFVMPIYNLLEYSKSYKKMEVCGNITKMNQTVLHKKT